MESTPTYLTLHEAARYLRVSTSTIRRAIDHGSLHASRVGRQYRFTRAQLDALVTSTRTTEDAVNDQAPFVQATHRESR